MGYIRTMDAAVIDGRQQRGLAISKGKRVKKIVDGTWLVPSQTTSGAGYVVDVSAGTCTCPDHELRGAIIKCKHRWAIDYVRHRVTAPDGTTFVTDSMRITYTQDWASYNLSQTTEKARVRVLLRALCDGIRNPVRKRGRGRPRHALANIVYAATMKTFVNTSGRRSMTELNDCKDMGFLDRVPSYNAVFDYLERPEMRPLLTTLVEESAAPVAAIDEERAYGFDGTGLGTSCYDRWFDHKYGEEKKSSKWVKLHIGIGVRSKIITAAKVTDGTMHDSPHMPDLLDATAKRFKIAEVLADKGYLGMPNLEAIEKVGATAYIPFKDNSVGEGPALWMKMWHMHSAHRKEFLEHYHQRSNVESVFSAMKRKFGPSVRTKDLDAQINEGLLKALCHNLSVLVQVTNRLGLDANFWKGSEKFVTTEFAAQ
jgi:hypothetical protein